MSASYEKRFKSIAELAEALGMSAASVRGWIKKEQIRVVRFGRRVLIPIDEYERVLKEGV